jgi:hypothetical protein
VSDDEDEDATTLYRPVGPHELALIAASGYLAFPPRLPEQPIFYPGLSQEYATQIARDWNVPRSGAGYVTHVRVRGAFLRQYDVHTIGSSAHQEYWVSAEELAELNRNIAGAIAVVAEFH